MIREAQPSDAKRIVVILVDSFQDKFKPIFGKRLSEGKEALATYYEQPCVLNDAFVAETDSLVAGVIQLHTTETSRGKKPLGLFRKLGFLGAVRAVLALLVLDHRVKDDECYIEHLAVASAFRGRGIGRQLLYAGESFARRRQKRVISLFVAADNYAAKQLYEKTGYVAVGVKRSLLVRLFLGKRSFVFMQKPLQI